MEQKTLFEIEENWKEEWQGMPEFVQEDLEAKHKIIVSFNNYEDVRLFSELINQKLTYKTKSIWYPEQKKGLFKDFKYIDDEK
jgi:hypothetical protein